ncbi:MAG: 2-oxoglutarate oxidoreductase [Clostridiales bacterium]|jgi:2-oxoglutarate ferredoxin oxidoreductase subunit beta|nr:2-oxoglutarate oxidoreductase [Clostridiales bacterium]
MEKVFSKPHVLTDTPTHYCPGCTHGVIHRIVAKVIDDLGIEGDTIGISPVGCAVFMYNYFHCDFQQAAHGRAPAVATGVKRVHPDKIVFTYQGDGDLAAIGTAETVHAATRGENITIVYINNSIYGMTGGQMAPTTLMGQVTQTTPYGREASTQGFPIGIAEMLSTLEGPSYIKRCAVDSIKHIKDTEESLRVAFQRQIDKKGFSLVEILSTCPTNWGMPPLEAMEWERENVFKVFPLGLYKDKEINFYHKDVANADEKAIKASENSGTDCDSIKEED